MIALYWLPDCIRVEPLITREASRVRSTAYHDYSTSSRKPSIDYFALSRSVTGLENPSMPVMEAPISAHTSDMDQAYNFLTQKGASNDATPLLHLQHLRRRIDWRIVPLMFLCYTMSFLDKVLLNVGLTFHQRRSATDIRAVRSCNGLDNRPQTPRKRLLECEHVLLCSISRRGSPYW